MDLRNLLRSIRYKNRSPLEEGLLSWQQKDVMLNQLLASLTVGLKDRRNMKGEKVSPWNTPLLIGNGSVDQRSVETNADRLV